MGLISNLLNPVKAVEGAVSSLLGGASGGGNPLQSLESLFGGGDSIGGNGGSGGDGSGSLMCIASLASLFI